MGIVLIALLIVLGLAAFIFTIWMLIDAIRNPRLTAAMKIVWVLVILLLEFIGALIYFFVARSPRPSSA
jgi:hypothetical protein